VGSLAKPALHLAQTSSYATANHSKIEAIPLSALPKGTTSELAGLTSHYPFSMLNVKHRSCEYQLLKSSGPSRLGNHDWIKVGAVHTVLNDNGNSIVYEHLPNLYSMG